MFLSNTTPNISLSIRSKSIKLRFIYKNYFGSLFLCSIQVLFCKSNSSSMLFSKSRFLAILSFNPNSFNLRRTVLTLMPRFSVISVRMSITVLNFFASDMRWDNTISSGFSFSYSNFQRNIIYSYIMINVLHCLSHCR